ncbi:MAG: 4Fe-4S dicluster domain-containing protein [Anaerolineales bacterium]
MGLLSAAERLASFDRSMVVLDESRCLHSQDRYSTCERCWNICPSSAIEQGKPPSLNEGNCTNCKACLTVCPVGAFQGSDSVKDLLSCLTRLETDSVELICQENEESSRGAAENTIGVSFNGCLASLGAGTLLTIFSMGIKEAYLRLDACQECRWKELKPAIDKQIELSRKLLNAWALVENLVVIDKVEDPHDRPLWDAHNAPISRRDLFKLATRQGAAALAQAVEKNHQKGRLPGRDHRRLVNSFSQFPEIQNSVTLTNADTFANITVSDTCTACGTCARACPTEAISINIDKEEKYFQLNFAPLNCIACEVCVHLCLPSSITMDKSITLNKAVLENTEVVLLEGPLSQCEQCKSYFPSKPDTYVCPTCEVRRNNPFGSIVPPGLNSIPQKERKDHD